MTALQVRDFPEELYERLREHADANHRSIAQQTIVAVEQMLSADKNSCGKETAVSEQFTARFEEPRQTATRPFILDTDAECATRAEKRRAIFAEADTIPWTGAMPTGDEIVATVHAQRDERDAAILEACGFPDETQQNFVVPLQELPQNEG